MNSNNKFNFLKKFKELIEHIANSTIHTTQDEKNSINDIKNTLTSHVENKANPHEVKMTQLQDVQITSLLDKQVLIWDNTQQKYVNTFITDAHSVDEKVKLISTSTDAKYLSELVDNSTIKIDTTNEKLYVESLKGQNVTITEINMLQGTSSNLQEQINNLTKPMTMFGVFNTYADLISSGKTPQDGSTSLVQNDENNGGKQWTYIYVQETSTWEAISESAVILRDFTINPINLTSEVTGILPQSNMDLTGLLTNSEISNYMKIEDYTGTGLSEVNIAKTLSGLNYSVSEVNDSVTNSHSHDNETYVDKISEDANGNLIYNGKTYSPITLEYDSTNNTLNIITN